MIFVAGAGALVVYFLSFAPLRRLIRSARRGAWIANSINAEYVMMAHLLLLIIGASLVADSILG